MSDFVVSLGKTHTGEALLGLLKVPYGRRSPNGRFFSFPWGNMAVLEEHLVQGKNIVNSQGTVLAWVGDLAGDTSEAFMSALLTRLVSLKNSRREATPSLENDGLLKQLNGAFSIVLADQTGVSIVTDPMSFTQVFVGKGREGNAASFGTHADLVALLSDASTPLDLVSIVQFLQRAHCTFPHTMHASVTEMQPGSVHLVELAKEGRPRLRCLSYWSPPREVRETYDEDQLARDLREALLASVRDRCGPGTIGVALSGGLDSRLVMAAIPKDVHCIGLTICDKLNREARTARRVAVAYDRTWSPLFRHEDYLAENMVGQVRLAGCECACLHAHLSGFAHAINEKVDTLLTGDLLDTFLRAYCAKDYDAHQRLGGLLPRRYLKIPFDYSHLPCDILNESLVKEVLGGMSARLDEFYLRNADHGRGSIAEWLKIYPFRQWDEVAIWAVHRRLFPIRLIGADRRLLDLAFACPVEAKLGGAVFLNVGQEIFGPGLRIPSANDGVRPNSGHLWRLAQRAVRKSRERVMRILERLGKEQQVEHSWHDYQKYWHESKKLDELRDEYGPSLDRLDGVLFKERGRALLTDKEIPWEYGFALLQLAIWLGVLEERRAAVESLTF